jgi:hypothetical protein|tara:strand:- start:151 stop:381 length:231 start_codon:yes stop_codon:yes gene_type:complete
MRKEDGDGDTCVSDDEGDTPYVLFTNELFCELDIFLIVVLEEFKLVFKYLICGLSIGSWYTLLFNAGGIIHEYILT